MTSRRSGRTDPLADAMAVIESESGTLPLPSAAKAPQVSERPDVQVAWSPPPMPESPRTVYPRWWIPAAVLLVLLGVAIGKLI